MCAPSINYHLQEKEISLYYRHRYNQSKNIFGNEWYISLRFDGWAWVKNSGCLINFGVDDDGDQMYKLVTWNMVLKGGVTGVQVWSQRKEFRNLATVFNNRKKTNQGLVSLINVMYYEIYGDRPQCINLLSPFYRT